jgi:type IX secretion system PorP/SprF family membrane protein
MRKSVFISLLALLGNSVSGQDIHFSQYFVAPQLLNPAAFGVFNSFEAGLQYKGQWNSFTNGYTSMAAFANKSFKPQNKANTTSAYASAGVNFIYDKAGSGDLTHFKVEIPVNVTKRVSNRGFLTAGIYAGFGQLALKNNNFTWGNQFDGAQYNSTISSNEATIGQSKEYLDCGAGISYVSFKSDKDATEMSAPKDMFGLSVSHLNKPNYSLYDLADDQLDMRFNFYGHHYFYLNNPNVSIIPSLLVQYQASAYELVLGASVRKRFGEAGSQKYKAFQAGLFYRLQDMCAVNCMFELNNYSLGLNYDFNVSKLVASSRSFGGLEISLKMNNPFRYAYKNPGTILEKF